MTKVMLYLNGDRARNEPPLYDSVLITVLDRKSIIYEEIPRAGDISDRR
jgi:hypothetical protein